MADSLKTTIFAPRMSHPSFSIIIPHYDIPDLLMRCLDSIPVREDIQVIVVDDCSPDADTYLQKYPALSRPFLELYHTPIGGSAGRARNIGLEHANGEWLIFIDADDFFAEDMEAILKDAVNRSEDILFYNYRVVKNSDLTTPGVRNWYSKYFADYTIDGKEDRFRYLFPSLVGKIFKRRLVTEYQIRFDETSHSNDVGFSFKCGAFAKEIGIVDRIFFVITEREGSLAAHQFTGEKPSVQEHTARFNVALSTQRFRDEHHIPFRYDTYKGYSFVFFNAYPRPFIHHFFHFVLPHYPQYALPIVWAIATRGIRCIMVNIYHHVKKLL